MLLGCSMVPPHGVAIQLTHPPTKTSGKCSTKHIFVDKCILLNKMSDKNTNLSTKYAFVGQMSGKKHFLAGKSSGKTHFLPDIGPAKFRQSIYLSTKYALSDILTAKVVEQSSGKIENCRQNMLCRTFFRQKYALSDIFVEQNVRQNHTVDKCMLSGPAGPGGRAARWQAQPAGPKSYCRQIYAFRAGRPRRPGCLYHSVHGILIYILNSILRGPPIGFNYLAFQLWPRI